MNRHPRILPECYGDTLLVELLGFKKPNHQVEGINQVLNELEVNMPKQIAVGVIDYDKKIRGPKTQQRAGPISAPRPDADHWQVVAGPRARAAPGRKGRGRGRKCGQALARDLEGRGDLRLAT